MYIQKIYIFLIRAINRLYPWFPEKISLVTRESFIASAKKYLWMKYMLGWDGKGDNGIDCSHLVCAAMIDAGGAQKYFHRTAHDLHRLSQRISLEEMMPWDIIFWPDEKERMEHVAIFLSKWENSLNIIDASGPSSGLWSTTERAIPIQESLSFGRPPFFISITKTDSERLAQIKMTYESGAKDYTERTSEVSLSGENLDMLKLRSDFVQMLPEQGSILDLGCGSGRDARFFEEKWFHITGIDISEIFVKALQDSLKGEYILGDIVDKENPVYKKKYDAIWANSSLVAITREEAKVALRNCSQSLEKGGHCFIGVKCHTKKTCMIEKESVSMPGKFISYLFYSEQDILDDIRDVGLTMMSFSKNQWIDGRDTFIRIFTQK